VLALCAFGFGALSIAAVWAQTVVQMAVLRGISGIFFSAMLPIALSLLSEMIPKRKRAFFMAMALIFFSSGSAASGVVAAWLLDLYGWQIGFWVGGMLGFAAVPLLWLVPESLAFRVARDPADPKIPATISLLDPRRQLPGNATFHLGDAEPRTGRNIGPLALLRAPYLVQTLILWCTAFLALGNIALLANWMPTFFQELGGIPIQEFAILAMIAFAGGAAGTATMGFLMDRVNPYWLITAFFLIDAAALYAMGQLPFGTGAFLVAMIAWQYTQIGGQTGINTLATLGYPPEMRSSGIGWAGGWGRISGIVIPAWAGAAALELALGLDLVMGLIALPALVIAALVFALGVVNGGRVGARPAASAGKPGEIPGEQVFAE
jgi:AAHS family 4-hydroxybenzoate transporter-like MFS transporter